MKANELRIGNFVNIINENGSYDLMVLSMYSNHIQVEFKGYWSFHISNYNPIPLTKEWLLKFGLDENKEIDLNDKKSGKIDFSNFEDPYLINSNFENFPLKKIEYVHQLQNIYFALTGEELKQG